MLLFIMPLKSKRVSSSWEQVSRLFERALRSACGQTSDAFKVIVICHEKPDISFSHPAIDYIRVDFSTPADADFCMPTQTAKSAANMALASSVDRGNVDKLRKVWIGHNYAHTLNCSHVMVLDSDDLVSNRLAELVASNPDSNGWFMTSGYFYKEGSSCIYLKKYKFHLSCGSCRIIRRDFYSFTQAFQNPLIVSRELLRRHTPHRQTRLDNGKSLNVLLFPGAIYSTENGDNILSSSFHSLQRSRRFGSPFAYAKDAFNYRLLSTSIRKEFGLYGIASKVIQTSSALSPRTGA